MSVVATYKVAFKISDAQEGSFSDKKAVTFSNSFIYIVSSTKFSLFNFLPLLEQFSYRQMELSCLINDS